jgi:adenine-specific DNA-methyltransferase
MTAERISKAKRHGQFFTPPAVAAALVRWVLRSDSDRVLDPSCGDGEFLATHNRAVGCELDAEHAATARRRAPDTVVHQGDFFAWAATTAERFDAVVGNPPFIRYQGFAGAMRDHALQLARQFGADLPALTSSWAPFVAASALLLKPGGRMAFVVPAEIGHATYAVPLIEALCASFGEVVVVAVRKKIFPALSENAWILYAADHGGLTHGVRLVAVDHFDTGAPLPTGGQMVSLADLRTVRGRLRRWLLPSDVRGVYERFEHEADVRRLGDLATVSIGYVSGANDFFHLRPSAAEREQIDDQFLIPTVRRGGSLADTDSLTQQHVQRWIDDDDAVLLLRIRRDDAVPKAVARYLDSDAGVRAREAYKCRVRDPWWSVPDVTVPDGFLTVMSGKTPQMTENAAGCPATNSLHVVRMREGGSFRDMQTAFASTLARLSCEVEGHPLGGGLLKLEPREAQRVLIPRCSLASTLQDVDAMLEHGIAAMREWRDGE